MGRKVVIKTLGSIENVIHGRAKENLTNSKAEQFFLGFGGALNEKNQFGEALVIDKTLYYTFVDDKKIQTESKKEFKTPFLVTLGKEFVKDADFQTLENKKQHDLMDFYEELSHRYPIGFCLMAEVKFGKMEAAYVKKPPIYNENVLVNAKDYWSDAEKYDNQKGIIIGLAVNESAKDKIPAAALAKIFYQNPNDKAKKKVLAHTHIALLSPNDKELVLNSKEEFMQNIAGLKPTGVRHLLNQSVFEKGNFLIFDIEKFL